MSQKLSVSDLDPAGKRVLVRVDFNVPLKDQDGRKAITDDTRITAALPTLRHLRERGARIILMSHLGRPKGGPNPEFSLAPVAERLAGLLGTPVQFAPDCVGGEAAAMAAGLADGEVLLLENVRFYAEEEKNDPAFAARLAALGELYVNDAFGTAHRAHASTEGVARLLPQAAAGFLMQRELKYLIEELAAPARPFVVIMGGSKVSDKIQVIMSLMAKADTIIIGGAMAYTFLKAQGHAIGNSRVEADKLDLALEILAAAKEKGVRFLLPIDTLETERFEEGAPTRCTARFDAGGAIGDGWMGIDIGAEAIAEFTAEIRAARTIIWNGPVGVFEIPGFAAGTRAVAEAIAEATRAGATSIIGGGDSVTAVNQFGLAGQMTFISTGGGASLELLEGKELPGVAVLSDHPAS
jgi:3-phosphoglycerate kinase